MGRPRTRTWIRAGSWVSALLMVVAIGLGSPAAAQQATGPLIVGGEIKEPRKVKHVNPQYPREASRAGLAGKVVLECTLDTKGRVSGVKVLEGVPPLIEAAAKAVSKWRYTSTELDGVPVPVLMTVTVNFKLSALDLSALLDSLDHRNEHIRKAAAGHLGGLRVGSRIDQEDVEKAIRALEPLAERDQSLEVRDVAARSLSKLDGRPLPPAAAPPAAPSTPRPIPGLGPPTSAWGSLVDPLGQCSVDPDGGRIEIEVPAGAYDLSIELGQTTAPRLMQPVEGDFEAKVTVDDLREPERATEGQPRRGYSGAGLLLWQDERSYVRLESAIYTAGGSAVRYALFEVRRDGKLVGGVSRADNRLQRSPAEFRLEREGTELRGLVRQGNEEWREVGRARVGLPDRLHVGVAAINTAQSPLRAGFRDFELRSKAGPARPSAGAPAVEDSVVRPSDAVMDYDSPPRPVHITRPQYPRDAFDEKIEGVVMVEILIDVSGRVTSSRVIQSIPQLDAAALECVRSWRFTPARKGGKVVPTIAHAPVRFRIY